MHIDFKRGQVSNIKAAENKKGAVECELDGCKIWLHRDLADKVSAGDEVLVAGRLNDDLLQADALNNFSQNRTAQIDGTNYIIGLGFGMFIAFLCAIQSYHLFAQADTSAATAMVLAAFGGVIGIGLAGQRFLAINQAARRVKTASQ